MSSFHCVSKKGCQNFTVFTEKNLFFSSPACSIPSITATEKSSGQTRLVFSRSKEKQSSQLPKILFPLECHLVLASPAARSPPFPWPALRGRAAVWVPRWDAPTARPLCVMQPGWLLLSCSHKGRRPLSRRASTHIPSLEASRVALATPRPRGPLCLPPAPILFLHQISPRRQDGPTDSSSFLLQEGPGAPASLTCFFFFPFSPSSHR